MTDEHEKTDDPLRAAILAARGTVLETQPFRPPEPTEQMFRAWFARERNVVGRGLRLTEQKGANDGQGDSATGNA